MMANVNNEYNNARNSFNLGTPSWVGICVELSSAVNAANVDELAFSKLTAAI